MPRLVHAFSFSVFLVPPCLFAVSCWIACTPVPCVPLRRLCVPECSFSSLLCFVVFVGFPFCLVGLLRFLCCLSFVSVCRSFGCACLLVWVCCFALCLLGAFPSPPPPADNESAVSGTAGLLLLSPLGYLVVHTTARVSDVLALFPCCSLSKLL